MPEKRSVRELSRNVREFSRNVREFPDMCGNLPKRRGNLPQTCGNLAQTCGNFRDWPKNWIFGIFPDFWLKIRNQTKNLKILRNQGNLWSERFLGEMKKIVPALMTNSVIWFKASISSVKFGFVAHLGIRVVQGRFKQTVTTTMLFTKKTVN